MTEPWVNSMVRACQGATEVRHAWDEWAAHLTYTPPDPVLAAQLAGVSHRGLVGLTIATGVWVDFRFRGLTDRTEPTEVIEAAWAANVDRCYSFPFLCEDDEWRGPVLGPLRLCMAIIVDALYGRNRWDKPSEPPCWMTRLALHVLPDPHPFRDWQETCIRRLLAWDTSTVDSVSDLFDDRQTDGAWIPIELFDPSFDLEAHDRSVLVSKFLASVEHGENPFLCTPEEMIDAGFAGIPYRLPPEPATQ